MGTFCDVFYIAFITKASVLTRVSHGSVGLPGVASSEDRKIEYIVANTTRRLRRGRTHCVNFQVDVPGSLSTIFSF